MFPDGTAPLDSRVLSLTSRFVATALAAAAMATAAAAAAFATAARADGPKAKDSQAGGSLAIAYLAVDRDGKTVAARAPEAPLIPASAMKIVTAACAFAHPPGGGPGREKLPGNLAGDVERALRYSDNDAAGRLADAVAADPTRPASDDPMERCVRGFTRARGLRLADAAGHSRTNRLSPRALVDLLAAARTAPWAQTLRDALAAPGEPGSLETRLPALAGRLRAKTGSLRGVASLAGYLQRSDGSEIAFAILLNGDGATAEKVDALVMEWAER